MADDFVADLKLHSQTIDYSGVGAHFQNGVAERAIQTIVTWARAMLMHQLIHWPQHFDPGLWPFAMSYAVHLWNHMPKSRGGLSPIELFSGTKLPSYDVLHNARVWGCPVYVLNPKLQDGRKLPKWSMRSRQGMFVGPSPDHASTVGNVLNLQTGSVSPQYHVVYDEQYSTTFGSLTDLVFSEDLWQTLLDSGGLQNTLDRTNIRGGHVPFEDFYNDFLDLTSDDSSVPEGVETDDESDDGDEDSVTSESPSDEETEPPDPVTEPYRTRSGRKVNPNPRFAGTYFGHSTSESPSKSSIPTFKRAQYQAGGVDRRRVRAGSLQSAFIHGLKWSTLISDLRSVDSQCGHSCTCWSPMTVL
jgi:hypothetical protein